MTTIQLKSLNDNLVPHGVLITDLINNKQLINKLVLFFYKLKKNYDNYQKGLSICPVKINWTTTPVSHKNTLKFNNGENIPANLSVKLYKYIFTVSTGFAQLINEAFRLDNLFKKESYRYFREKICCDNLNISNYNQYYFMQ